MAAQSYACEVKLFNKWSYDDISVGDISLEDYIAVKPKFAQFVPITLVCGRKCSLAMLKQMASHLVKVLNEVVGLHNVIQASSAVPVVDNGAALEERPLILK